MTPPRPGNGRGGSPLPSWGPGCGALRARAVTVVRGRGAHLCAGASAGVASPNSGAAGSPAPSCASWPVPVLGADRQPSPGRGPSSSQPSRWSLAGPLPCALPPGSSGPCSCHVRAEVPDPRGTRAGSCLRRENLASCAQTIKLGATFRGLAPLEKRRHEKTR